MRLYFISLGCDKNLVDSKRLIRVFSEHGHTVVDDVKSADAAIINTCCFIQSATEESIAAVLEMAAEKEAGNLKAVVVAGCMAERYRDQIHDELPEVDALIDTHSIEDAARILEEIESLDSLDQDNQSRVPAAAILTPGYFGYLKIADGCDKHCTYCVIPSIRGSYKSVLIDELIEEAHEMAADGVRELILVAQETTLYGQDLYGSKKLPELLEKLCAIEGIEWIRLLYCYPEEITDELIACMAAHPKVCHYIDMPIQHTNDRVLHQMGRRTNQKQIRDIVRKLRIAMPDIAIRTTFISGFPSETEDEHAENCRFIREMQFDRVGIFTYSREEGTAAAVMSDQIPETVKESRRKELYEIQQEVVFSRNETLIGSEENVLIEGALTDDPCVYAGRSYRDAPQVDGLVFVQSEESLQSGDIIPVRITGASGYDLTGIHIA